MERIKLAKTIVVFNDTFNATMSKFSREDRDLLEDNEENRTITIWAAASIALAVCITVMYLCCRELNRRRLEAEFLEELTRKEIIKEHVEKTIEQMERAEDSKSYLEHMESKVPFVTFGHVTSISPNPSFDSLHHRAGSHLHLPLPHHHNYSPLTSEDEHEGSKTHSNNKHPNKLHMNGSHKSRHIDDISSHGSSSSGASRRDRRALFHGDHHHRHSHHSMKRTSFLTFMKDFIFKRSKSTSSEESESGGEDCENNGIWIEVFTSDDN